MIRFENVSKAYDAFTVLDSVSFEVHRGEIFGIIGESGAGKSTLLRLVNQLETHDAGTVFVNGTDMSTLTAKSLRTIRKEISVVFQNFNLLKNRSVAENVALPLTLSNVNDTARVEEVLTFVNLLDKKDHYPNQLSGGERQRVAIARALATNPNILICDEPTSALDPKSTADLLDVLKSINEVFGTTIVVVTHQLEVAKAICNRVAVMERGVLKDVVTVYNLPMETDTSYVAHAKAVLQR
ncbi:methionine ABC transporter ATP-binding protein [Erysipelothrix anatis]|uniref:methionine ABC transporter ATP-binding protein n=1 Tax=Erysipelothrix anatis TaxID=2683713 RepID=UPI00140850B9|nr:ATP-binding cassette domain-containing protein [Erysipelothrix anatis]